MDRRVAAESRYHSKQREVEEKRQELLSLQRRIAGKTKDIEAGNVKREEERKAYLKKHGVHEDTLARAHSIVKAVKSEGMTAAEDAASLIELAATRHGFRAEGQEVLGKSGGADHVKRIHTMLDRLVASVESSLSTVRAHETRAQESWKAVKVRSAHAYIPTALHPPDSPPHPTLSLAAGLDQEADPGAGHPQGGRAAGRRPAAAGGGAAAAEGGGGQEAGGGDAPARGRAAAHCRARAEGLRGHSGHHCR